MWDLSTLLKHEVDKPSPSVCNPRHNLTNGVRAMWRKHVSIEESNEPLHSIVTAEEIKTLVLGFTFLVAFSTTVSMYVYVITGKQWLINLESISEPRVKNFCILKHSVPYNTLVQKCYWFKNIFTYLRIRYTDMTQT